ncbi:hypothetical protein PR202_ga14329 [Eleusine coracana subsp. coracana]|uniref:GDSL esterase/lipase n=1 Tax=Eleusine coracana subsp. coracana TaxID=191504 RepID=A0AAV5CH22_ELECO|nr:hypothetical protein PR202_ga14329 [Eleusine coracana subsp. coracana]
MYVFGDSLVDVGNNNYLPGNGVSRANRAYYGKDYPSSRIPTGRFSNSGLPVAATRACGRHRSQQGCQLCVRRSWDPQIHRKSRSTAGNTIPLWKQVQYFNATRTRIIATHGSSGAVNDLLARSIFLICIGSNDIFAFAIATQNNQQMMMRDAAAFYNSLISIYSDTIKELYRMGARRFAIMNVGLVGCVPVARLLSPTGSCSDGLNKLAAGFNEALSSLMLSLAKTKQLPELVYSLANSHGVTRWRQGTQTLPPRVALHQPR